MAGPFSGSFSRSFGVVDSAIGRRVDQEHREAALAQNQAQFEDSYELDTQRTQAYVESAQAAANHNRALTESVRTKLPYEVDLLKGQARNQNASAGLTEAQTTTENAMRGGRVRQQESLADTQEALARQQQITATSMSRNLDTQGYKMITDMVRDDTGRIRPTQDLISSPEGINAINAAMNIAKRDEGIAKQLTDAGFPEGAQILPQMVQGEDGQPAYRVIINTPDGKPNDVEEMTPEEFEGFVNGLFTQADAYGQGRGAEGRADNQAAINIRRRLGEGPQVAPRPQAPTPRGPGQAGATGSWGEAAQPSDPVVRDGSAPSRSGVTGGWGDAARPDRTPERQLGQMQAQSQYKRAMAEHQQSRAARQQHNRRFGEELTAARLARTSTPVGSYANNDVANQRGYNESRFGYPDANVAKDQADAARKAQEAQVKLTRQIGKDNVKAIDDIAVNAAKSSSEGEDQNNPEAAQQLRTQLHLLAAREPELFSDLSASPAQRAVFERAATVANRFAKGGTPDVVGTFRAIQRQVDEERYLSVKEQALDMFGGQEVNQNAIGQRIVDILADNPGLSDDQVLQALNQ